MIKMKMQLVITLSLLLIFSMTFGSIALAEGTTPSDGGNDSSSACSLYSKRFDGIGLQPGAATYITVNGDGTATAKFITTEDCVEVSFSVYTYEGTPAPYDKQVHFDGSSQRYNTAGSYELTIDLPTCGKAQLDLYAGPIQEKLKNPDGHAGLTLRNFLMYATTDCTTTTPTPSSTATSTPSPTPTSTSTTPVETPTNTPPSETPSPTPTSTSTTPVETPTDTPPSETPSPTPTSTSTTPVETPTDTPPSETPSPTPTSTSTTPVETPSSTPPSSLPSTPPSDAPTETPIIVIDEPVPAGGGNPNDVEHSTDEVIPLDTLPKTGEKSSMPYYVLGTIMTMTGLLSLKKRTRRNNS